MTKKIREEEEKNFHATNVEKEKKSTSIVHRYVIINIFMIIQHLFSHSHTHKIFIKNGEKNMKSVYVTCVKNYKVVYIHRKSYSR